jgi:hypothetical protein
MDKVGAPRLHKTMLGLDEPHEIWADGNGECVKDFDTERRYHASVLLRHLRSPDKVLDCAIQTVLSPKSAAERIGMMTLFIIRPLAKVD